MCERKGERVCVCVLFMYACLYVCVRVRDSKVDENIVAHILFKVHQRTSGLSVARWNCLFLSSCNREKGAGALVCRMKGSRLAMCVFVRVYYCVPFLIQLNSPPLPPTPPLPPCPGDVIRVIQSYTHIVGSLCTLKDNLYQLVERGPQLQPRLYLQETHCTENARGTLVCANTMCGSSSKTSSSSSWTWAWGRYDG